MTYRLGIPWSAGLRVLAARFGDSVAITSGTKQLSYTALCACAHALAVRVVEAGGKAGNPVGTLLPNGLPAVWAAYGVRMTGAAETPMNYGYTDENIAWSARIAGFRAVVTLRERAEAVLALGLQPIIVEEISTIDPEITFPAVSDDAQGRILFSSGTTGKPKGAVYSHSRRWIGEQLLKAVLPFTPSVGSRILLMTPFSHGASLLTFAWCDYGGEVVLMNGVDTNLLRDPLRSGGIDAIFAPPTVLAKMAAAFGNEHFPGVRCVFTGTQALAVPTYEKAIQMFGSVVRITLGKTECINPITVLGASDCDAEFSLKSRGNGACVGWPAPGVELQIHTESTSNPKDGSTAGEVWLRAPHMSNGLIDIEGFKPHEPDGWHRTGDQGHIDARGRLWLTGRIADEIKTGGYRVDPDEIESLLVGLSSCGSVCVTAIASEYWGEVIIAVAEKANEGWEVQAAESVKHLTRYKRPRAYVAIDELPRNHQGKVSRREVREMILAMHDFIDGPYPSLIRQKILAKNTLNPKKDVHL
jgi:acyl-CoA synthetase (AMP-forming)/AMP-acid ligase II